MSVKDGVELMGQAGQTLEKISEHMMQINGLIRQISTSASEQAMGLKEVNAAVNQMDQVTQQNAAMVEETTAASMTLRSESETLRDLVARFEVTGASKLGSSLRATAAMLRAATDRSDAGPDPFNGGLSRRPAAAVAVGGASRGNGDWEEF